jgi:hypothetical protein
MKGAPLRDGELLSVEMSVPAATEGLLDFGGSFSSYARVVRTGDTPRPNDPDNAIALEFCDSPKLRI